MRHPKSSDRFRAFLVSRSLIELIAWYIAILGVAALPLAFMYNLFSSDNENVSLLIWFRYAFFQLWGTDSQGISIELDSLQFIPFFISRVFGVIFPALFLGTIVFKFLIARYVIVYRKKISLMEKTNGEYSLVIRIYSSSRLLLVDNQFRVFLRIRYASGNASPVLRNYQLSIPVSDWPIAKQHVPFSVYVPLHADDIAVNDAGEQRLCRIQGHELKEKNELFVLTQGSLPELDTSFMDEHTYRIPENVECGHYGSVDVDYDRPSSSWSGWNNFEKNEVDSDDYSN